MRAPGDGGRPRVLVVGAGLAGMTLAHHVAEWGAEVLLVDNAPHVGGAFLFLDHTFTTDSCGLCMALPRQPSLCPTIASQDHPRITPLTRTTLTRLEGGPGRLEAGLRRAPVYVDPERCDCCGACAEVCPVARPSSPWGRPLHDQAGARADAKGQRAIYPPQPRAVPQAFAIDPGVCTGCGACVSVCSQGAIDLAAEATDEVVEVGAVVLAPGLAPFDAARAVEYGWGRCANVVTSLELERMLNRSGPTRGQVLRPSDGEVPARMAFIHCVGSRSEALGRPYCSSSCCMITAKQVGMAKEAIPEAEVKVFTMDLRTSGKGYDRYHQRVASLPGVTYQRGRPAAVHELPGSGNLRLLTPDGEEIVELLVLAVGMGPADGASELAESAGVAVDEYGFILTGEGGPGSTSRPGVFSAGHGVAPADVPETMTQAEAAAALVVQRLSSGCDHSADTARAGEGVAQMAARFSSGSVEKRGNARTVDSLADRRPRVGVFLCTCHGALCEGLDLTGLADAAQRMRGVDYVEVLDAACEEPDLTSIERTMSERELNRAVIAGCSPRLHAERFESLMNGLGLPAPLLERANIREGAAWPHEENVAGATAVARGELAMAVAAVRETGELFPGPRARDGAVERILVLGAGLAGMTAAVTLAELGLSCDLVERDSDLGGNLRDAVRTLEGIDPQALLTAGVEQVEAHDTIRLMTEAELVDWSGSEGDFRARIRVGDGLIEERYGALIVATGAEAADAGEYLYGQHRLVVTQRELARAMEGSAPVVETPEPRSVVMIQCVGSREEDTVDDGQGQAYCSRVCCSHAIANALALKRRDPTTEVSILFRDVRTPGTQELYYREARRLGVQFLRYQPPEKPEVESEGDVLKVRVHDTLYDEMVALDADLLVLSTGIVPPEANEALAQVLGIELDQDGFFAEVHPKLRPVDLPTPGLFVCGLAYGPRSIVESVGQARAAAMRAALAVARPPEIRREAVTVVRKLCSFCGMCVAACPYGARVLDHEERVARVVDELCHGCGACVALCPNGASRQPAFEPARGLALVDAALD